MNVHIVHLPHTFTYLFDLSLAFRKYGFDTVTLVANGFEYDQIKELEKLAELHDFIQVMDIPTKRILSHGQALNFAFKHSADPYFCFADHDIFPTADIGNDLKKALMQADVVCVGNRPENTDVEYRGFAASATKSQSGTPLATSFFSVCKRLSIEEANSRFNVGFEQYFRRSQIPQSLSHNVDIQSLEEPFLIDTCKAISLALNKLNYKISHLGSEKVCHLGGLCGAINRFVNGNKDFNKVFVIKNIPSSKELQNYYKQNQKRHPKVMEVKRTISDFALQILIAYQQAKKLPVFETDDETIHNSLTQIVEETSKVFNNSKH